MLSIKKFTAADHYQVIADGPFPEFFVSWDSITLKEAIEFKAVVDTSVSERPLQCFLQLNPKILVQPLRSGHGRWVIPQKRLGEQFISDFMIGERDSLGFYWTAVELESPKAKLFTKKGDPSQTLNHAIRQIQDWRSWLSEHHNYASTPKAKGGLGLKGIKARIPGIIVIGRRASLSESDNRLRRQYSDDLDIAIHTYDYLAEAALQRASWLEKGVYINYAEQGAAANP